ncbi:MAG: undecaprenyl-phosphate glucose phosphotransferase [Candidatus Binatia bacterium]
MRLSDLLFVSVAWWLAYGLRFHSPLFSAAENYVVRHYVVAWLIILLVWAAVFAAFDFYRPRRLSTHWREILDLIKCSALALLIFLGILFLVREIVLSRIVVVLFWTGTLFLLNVSHLLMREGLRFFRRRGYNLRHMVIAGTAEPSVRLLESLNLHRHLGHRVIALYPMDDTVGASIGGNVKVITDRAEFLSAVRSGQVDGVFVALPLEQSARIREIQQWFADEPIDLYFVPDLGKLSKVHGNVEEFDGMQIISLRAAGLYGWNSLLKRGMDLTIGAVALLLSLPTMLVIAVTVKLTSFGPVLYRQQRMGLDGRRFEMLKFRTMVADAENMTGPVWSIDDDPRVTYVGRWLRRTSLDELPQLLNVLRGEMSLVGPRPERPPLIEEFRKTIPKYMLRHQVKAGMTGWAQVNGWRGNTSLERRIEHDLEYIENWSLGRDVKILALTLLAGFRGRRATPL